MVLETPLIVRTNPIKPKRKGVLAGVDMSAQYSVMDQSVTVNGCRGCCDPIPRWSLVIDLNLVHEIKTRGVR